MTENKLALQQSDSGSYALLYRRGDDRSVTNRLNTFAQWCADTGTAWFNADLGIYRDHLLEDLQPSSVQAHLSTLRQRIKDVTTDNKLYQQLHNFFGEHYASPADVEAQTQMFIRKLENMANARHSSVRVTKIQDYADSQRLWLNGGADNELFDKIMHDKDLLPALRDRAIVAAFLGSGVRVAELCALKVSDFYETYKGHAALRVRQGKGNKQRMVVWGDLVTHRDLDVQQWIDSVSLTSDEYVFQSFWHGNKILRNRPLDKYSVWRIISSVELSIGKVSPHDLRRTYARMLFKDFKMGMEEIRDQMGHTSITITEEYIGMSNIEERVPRRS